LWWNEVAVLAALIIVFREVFEAGLVVGIVMAVTRSVAQRGWCISGGVLGGLLGACVVAAFAGTLSAMFAGSGQELFNAGVLSLAVVMLTWHNVWMARHGRELAAEMRAVGEAVAAGQSSLFALAVVVGVAVLREGSEVVLFLYGIVATEGWSSVFAGGVAGLALGAVICALTYFGLLRIPGRYLFAATSLMIAFLAAGMASQAVAFLEQADVLTALGAVVWDSSWLLPDSGLIGRALHTLVGYSDRPTEMQLAAYAATLGATFLLMRLFAPVPKVAPAR
jgi:high-affinity iron transporter